MFGWLRKFGDRVDYQTPPQEAVYESRDQAAIEDEIEKLDRKIHALRLIPPWQRSAAWSRLADKALDERNAVRPGRPREVPVVPGRAEASIHNYGENPW